MTARVDVIDLRGAAIVPHLPALAALRIRVFRAFPYLYDGDEANEARYLAAYGADDACLVVAAFDGSTLVGASTAMPAARHGDEVAPSLRAAGLSPDDVYYLGESVLEPAYRGRGLGDVFFARRVARARELGFRWAAFCAVELVGEQHPPTARRARTLPHRRRLAPT